LATIKEDKMRNAILLIVLILALLTGVISVAYYAVQEYEYSLDLEEEIPVSNVFVVSPEAQLRDLFGGIINNSNIGQTPSTIQSFSVILGKMSFENKGSLSQIVEVPRLMACVDLSSTPSLLSSNSVPTSEHGIAFWTIYSVSQPSFIGAPNIPREYYAGINEIYPQYNYAQSGQQNNIEIKKGEKLTYYIYLKDAYLQVRGNSSSDLRNTKIDIYDVPIKNSNPLGEEAYSWINPTCEGLARESEPVKTVKFV
jgi:hypothetical protein